MFKRPFISFKELHRRLLRLHRRKGQFLQDDRIGYGRTDATAPDMGEIPDVASGDPNFIRQFDFSAHGRLRVVYRHGQSSIVSH
jgi:hypothetical protein